LGQGLDAGVARGGVDVVAARTEGADEGVLAPARSDDEYAHARSLPARQPVPLLGEHREVDLGAPLALEELVVHQPGLLPHAQPPGQLHRWLVALLDPGDDAVQAESLEAEPQ